MKNGKPFTVLLTVFVALLFGGPRPTDGRDARALGNGSQDETRPAERPDAPAQITLPAGATISVRVADEVNSSHNHPGDLLTGIVDPSVFIADHVVIPRGTEAHIRVMEDRKGGRIHGKAAISLALVGVVINGEKLDVESEDYTKKQGVLSSKVKAAGMATPGAGASAATSPNPAGGAVGPAIAIFTAAKVELHAGNRVPFVLTMPFTFDKPVEPATATSSTNNKE